MENRSSAEVITGKKRDEDLQVVAEATHLTTESLAKG